MLRTRRDGDQVVAEADFRPAEGVPVEVGVERVGDDDALCRRRRGRVVLEVDAVGEPALGRDKVVGAEAGGAGLLVGVD